MKKKNKLMWLFLYHHMVIDLLLFIGEFIKITSKTINKRHTKLNNIIEEIIEHEQRDESTKDSK